MREEGVFREILLRDFFLIRNDYQENLHARGEPIMLQLCVVPAYSLTVR